MKKRLHNQRGQAAVETLFSIPIFLIIFVIGFELFGITWNAQYAHATARYNAFAQAKHKPCKSFDGSGDISGGIEASSDQNNLSGDQSPYMQTFAQDRSMTQTAYIVCN